MISKLVLGYILGEVIWNVFWKILLSGLADPKYLLHLELGVLYAGVSNTEYIES